MTVSVTWCLTARMFRNRETGSVLHGGIHSLSLCMRRRCSVAAVGGLLRVGSPPRATVPLSAGARATWRASGRARGPGAVCTRWMCAREEIREGPRAVFLVTYLHLRAGPGGVKQLRAPAWAPGASLAQGCLDSRTLAGSVPPRTLAPRGRGLPLQRLPPRRASRSPETAGLSPASPAKNA